MTSENSKQGPGFKENMTISELCSLSVKEGRHNGKHSQMVWSEESAKQTERGQG